MEAILVSGDDTSDDGGACTAREDGAVSTRPPLATKRELLLDAGFQGGGNIIPLPPVISHMRDTRRRPRLHNQQRCVLLYQYPM